jgi:acetoin utilization deacetylase AcuC-like enzyme
MNILYNSKFLQHNPGSYAEGPYRIEEFAMLARESDSDAGSDNNAEPDSNAEPESITESDINAEPDRNGEEFITLIHSESHLELVREACMNNHVLAEVYLSPESYDAACSAVGLAVMAAEQGDFAVVRPPGHHAKPERADGFCLFNNIAIAAQKLVNEGNKVFILDIDGHHGDGTQGIFYRSDKVLFCSVHQQYAYPWTGEPGETGEGKGKGYTMNFPLPAGSGDRELLEAVETAILRAKEFKPDAVGISAGFDGYHEDRLLGLNYSLDAYYQCGLKLGQSFEHIFAVLEGGYHMDIMKCVEHFIRGVHDGNP